jgi:hypothetical protein
MTLSIGRLALIFFLASPLAAKAEGMEFYRGRTLMVVCDADNPVYKAVCLGYVAGVADVLGEANGGNVNGFQACFHTDDTTDAAILAVRVWLHGHPEYLKYSAAGAVAAALAEAWPCAGKKRTSLDDWSAVR